MDNFFVKFLGVRGSVPTCGPDFIKYGGHTSCIMVRCGETLIIFDAGSGIVDINDYIHTHKIKTVHLFLSHVHLDHVLGFPFFKSMWDKDAHVHIYCGTLHEQNGINNFLCNTFNPPLFPIPFNTWPCRKSFIDFKAGALHHITDEIKIKTCELNHPDGAIGYRLEYNKKSMCYITDHEHGNININKGLESFVTDADMLIYDASYDDEYYQNFKGWGHSTWQEACELGQRTNIKKTVLFHHDPENTDNIMDERQKNINQSYNDIIIAKQGMIINLS